MLDALLAEIAAHYGTGPITVTSIEIPFPFNTTSALIDGIFGFSLNFGSAYGFFQPVSLPGVTVDFLDQFNAKGGRTENLRRLISRRSTCTFSASGQFIQIPAANAALVAAITSIDDLAADDSIRICTGNLSTQLASAYFPSHPVFASRGEDIVECYQRLADGLANAACPAGPPGPPLPLDHCHSDVMLNSLPVIPTNAQLGVPGPGAMAPSVDTHIEAGTPYWVAMEGIKCEEVPSPPGPFPDGTFRECERINR
jgi:hypothetical protein